MAENKLLVARGDVLVHRVLHMGTDPATGGEVEVTEGVNLRAGDAVEVSALASYQQKALTDPETDGGHFKSLFAEMSEKEHGQLVASRETAARTVSNEASKTEGDATVTKLGPGAEIDATEGAKEYAKENNIDLSEVTGTGSNGRITKDDVVAYHEEGKEG